MFHNILLKSFFYKYVTCGKKWFWYNYTETGTGTDKVHKLLISDTQLSGWIRSPKHYLGAYKAQISSQGKLQSVAGTFAANSGHNNYNNTSATSLIDFRNYARAKDTNTYNWNVVTYWMRKTLWMLFVTEYANLDSQATFNGELTVDNYHQGGLGLGVTQGNATNSIGGSAQTITGYTNQYGNYSIGSLSLEATDMYGGATAVTANKKCRYRGIENPFGEVWEVIDGVFIPDSSIAYEIIDKANYTHLKGTGFTGNISTECRSIGTVDINTGGVVIESILGGSYCDIFPATTGEIIPNLQSLSGSTYDKYYSDGWWYTQLTNTGLRSSCSSNGGARSGFSCIGAYETLSNAYFDLSTRLSYIP